MAAAPDALSVPPVRLSASTTHRDADRTVATDTADGATRAEQVSVAREVRAEQGWKAWPVCSKKAGVA